MPYDIQIGRNDEDKKLFGEEGFMFLGKSYVKMGNYTSISNRILVDVARNHVIMVAGKRGSGKCLHEDTLITLANGTQIPIKELEKNNEKIISLNNNLKLEQSEKSEFFSRQVNKLLKIKLRSGKEIKLTPEHPLLTIKSWQEAQKLTIGSRIATPRNLPIFGNYEMSDHEVKLLAYLIAEGHTKSVVLFANSDEKIVDDFRDSLEKLDPTLRLIKEKENHYRISSPLWKTKVVEHDLSRNNKGQFLKERKNIYEKRSIRRLIENEGLFGLLSPQKFLSQNIMQLNKSKLVLFLSRLFSCDGSIYKTNNIWQISYASSSGKMIRQIQNLLLRFKILSKMREKHIKLNGKKFTSFELVINSDNVINFVNEIGFFGRKEERQKLALTEMGLKRLNPNVDTIPKEIWETYKPANWAEIGRQLGYAHPKAMRERVYYSPSRQTLMQIAKVEESNPLMLLAQSDIFWDEITSIELLEGDFIVYDICVPGNHNFVANDIIVHNSYTLGVIAEELSNLKKEISQNIGSLIFDTMGIFWTMKYSNEKDKELLYEWKLNSGRINMNLFVPFGHYDFYLEQGIPADEKFAIGASELDSEDWVITFGLSIINPIAVLIERVLKRMKEEGDYTLKDIIRNIGFDEKSSTEVKNAAASLFEAAETWGIFAEKKEDAVPLDKLIVGGKTTVLDLSVYNSVGAFNVRALVIGLLSKKIFNQRMASRKKEEVKAVSSMFALKSYEEKKETPLVWIFIDEAHEFLPLNGKTAATDALVQLLREGRQPGISLVLATQQPGQIHRDAMTQSDIVIAHKVTAQPDLEALNYIMQSYLLDSIKKYVDDLPNLKGSAIVLDDNSERIYPMRVRPRFTWHGGEAPSAMKAEKRL